MFLAEGANGNQAGSGGAVACSVCGGEGNAVYYRTEVRHGASGIQTDVGHRGSSSQDLIPRGRGAGLDVGAVGGPDQGVAAQRAVFGVGGAALEGDLEVVTVGIKGKRGLV